MRNNCLYVKGCDMVTEIPKYWTVSRMAKESVWVLSEIRHSSKIGFFLRKKIYCWQITAAFFEQIALKTGQNNSCFL